MTLQPYQEATQEIKRQGELPYKAAKALGPAVLGGISLGRVLPLLNKLVPADIARKGLEAIDSRFGKFFKKAELNGTSFEEAREFIKQKLTPEQEEKRVDTLKKFNEKKKMPTLRERETERFQNQYGNISQQPQQGMQQNQGPGAQALMSILQKINQNLGQ